MPTLIGEDEKFSSSKVKKIFIRKDEEKKKKDFSSLCSSDVDDLDLNLSENLVEDPEIGCEIKCLPTKERVWYRNNYIFLDHKTFGIVWQNFFLFILLHCLVLYAYYLMLANFRPGCLIIGYFFGLWGGLGVTAGAHRLWAHRSYSAKPLLRVFLMIGHTIAGQNNLYVWCRDHRVHHKFSETDADPHNSLRGFFFAHIGWLLHKKHPQVFIKGFKVELKDLQADPVIRFQIRYYYILYFLFAFMIPTSICVFFFNESWWNAFMLASVLRYGASLHCTWFVNSAAHLFGARPYNQRIQARENPFVSYAAFGEGYHNYHHTFPWDYATSELGSKLNLTKKFIEIMAYLGLAYDLKRAPKSIVSSYKTSSILIEQSKQQLAY